MGNPIPIAYSSPRNNVTFGDRVAAANAFAPAPAAAAANINNTSSAAMGNMGVLVAPGSANQTSNFGISEHVHIDQPKDDLAKDDNNLMIKLGFNPDLF